MKVALLSFEVAPFSKVGGLADVAGSLPKALAAQGVDIRVFTPKHRSVMTGGWTLRRAVEAIEVRMPSFRSGCALDEAALPGSEVPVYFIEHHQYYNRESIYGSGGGFGDQLERLAFFVRATLAAFRALDWEPEVLHLNDHHAALGAAYTRLWDLPYGTIFTAHNLGPAYQGRFPQEQMGPTGLDWGDERVAQCIQEGALNLARVGFVFSDFVNTVSVGYAKEIQQPEWGGGIDDLARQRAAERKLVGIINGIDYGEWNPRTDPDLPAHFSSEDLAGKAVCKAAAQREFGLAEAPDRPLVTMVTRLDAQKGLDLVVAVAPEMSEVQWAILGTGDPRYEQALTELAARYPHIGVKIMFSPRLAKLLYAGGDMLVMPSRYEPCGLAQMIALAYGNIPIVRATGGLADTIKEKGQRPNGFRFQEYCPEALRAAVERAVAAYQERARWAQLVQNAFACDFSWAASAKAYRALYRRALKR